MSEYTYQGAAAWTRPTAPPNQLAVLEQLLDEQAAIAGDVVEMEEHWWAIHGRIPVDGDVVMAVYHTEAEARSVLGMLAGGAADSGLGRVSGFRHRSLRRAS